MSEWFVPGEVPSADEISQRWWDATRSHLLTVQTCTACAHAQHPPRALCTGCGSMDHLGQSAAAGTGVVDTFTVVHRAPRPDLAVPYTVARVRLDEGPILLTRLSGTAWTIGDRVEVDWIDLPDGRALPVFNPSSVTPH